MSNQGSRFELPALPFERHSLEPAVSRAQIDLLYSHYHRRQLEALNRCLPHHEPRSLPALAQSDDAAIRQPAAEAWNLVFFWHGLVARAVPVPEPLLGRVKRDFGSLGALEARWRKQIMAAEDAGWSWLVAGRDGILELMTTAAGQSPSAHVPLLSITLAHEACRIDFGQNRGAWFEALWPHLNWEYAALHLELGNERTGPSQ